MKLKTFLILVFFIFLLINCSFAEDFITKGPALGEIYFIAPHPNTLHGLALYHSWDYGLTNIIMDSLNEMRWIASDSDNGKVYYSFLNVFYYSSNYGNNWTPISNITGGDIYSGRVSGEVFDNAIWYSNDYGLNWIQHQGNGLTGNIGDYESSTLGNLAGEVYFLSSKGYLFFSPDTGNNFTPQTNLSLIQAHDHYLRRGSNTGELYLYNNYTQEIFFSTDSGKTFNIQHQFVFQPTDIWYSDATGSQQPGEVFVLAYRYFPMSFDGEFYIYHSTDYGQTWSSYHHLTTIDEKASNPIKTFNLSQNYPNPFNPVTHIKYQLPKPSKVKLEIFNVLGQRVKTLVDKYQTADYFTVAWKGLNDYGHRVGSGVYICRITAKALDGSKEFVNSKKLLMVK